MRYRTGIHFFGPHFSRPFGLIPNLATKLDLSSGAMRQAVVVACGCTSPCVNRDVNCSMWAKLNQCAENPHFMHAAGWRLSQPLLLIVPPHPSLCTRALP